MNPRADHEAPVAEMQDLDRRSRTLRDGLERLRATSGERETQPSVGSLHTDTGLRPELGALAAPRRRIYLGPGIR
jgi:hypothetical protein